MRDGRVILQPLSLKYRQGTVTSVHVVVGEKGLQIDCVLFNIPFPHDSWEMLIPRQRAGTKPVLCIGIILILLLGELNPAAPPPSHSVKRRVIVFSSHS